ncbi:MAG TPA: STAS domain-containing protein [Candidatus Limnocylindrales bacterium]|nr:STAS domain-containing protein [Candidatus Limnocylindrales bacterium]
MELKKKQIKPGVAVLEMRGRILMGPDCKIIEKEIDELIAANETRVIFDLSGVSQIDSAGVGQVVKSFTRLKKSGGELRLAGVTGMLDGVFKMTQVHKVIGMYPTPGDASEAF